MGSLAGTVAVVTGASRGLGKGIALGLGEAGATVYVTGRSTNSTRAALPGTIEETANEVTRAGGRGVAVRCDHRLDSEVEAVFERVRKDEGRLDVLVNNASQAPSNACSGVESASGGSPWSSGTTSSTLACVRTSSLLDSPFR